MTVGCPSCGTRYRLPPRSKLGARPTFRCTRCDQVFDPEGGAEGPALDDVDDEATAPTSFELARDDADERPARPDPNEGLEGDVRDDADDRNPLDASFDDVPNDDDDVAPPDGPRRRAEPEVPVAGPPPARFALRGMLLVAMVYAVLSIWLYTHPRRVEELLAGIPIIGPPMETRISPAHIQLADVRGEYHRVQGDTLVFAITGTALNNAPVPVSGVQIQGTVRGDVEQRQTVFAGAAPRAVEALSAREIDLLQTLVPPKEWSLAPGEQTTFLVVFRDPPVPLEELTAEVVAVRRGGPRRAERTAGAR